ncbi:hypothetical protein ABL_05002 [Aspergillus niger]|uniref:DNA2/NAM7 helicase-like C-terminal domain-containing protein n=1 Tax=Aspergillus niger TaxID=5061 RepID=A0A100IKC4_ASPNG|nr:hypothetical protein ABL_05002 [Aspergillus niger]
MIDSLHGGEAAVIIFDTTATDGPGFLKQRGLLNVALSRARAAIYVIINMNKWNKAKQEQHSIYIQLMVDIFSNRKCCVRILPAMVEDVKRLAADEVVAVYKEVAIPDRFKARDTDTCLFDNPSSGMDEATGLLTMDTAGNNEITASYEGFVNSSPADLNVGQSDTSAVSPSQAPRAANNFPGDSQVMEWFSPVSSDHN